jgi:hypothetical protein
MDSPWPTPEGELWGGLVERLTSLARDPLLEGEAWVYAIAAEFLASGIFDTIDDHIFEILLAWAGVDLTKPDGLNIAVFLTGFVQGTGLIALACDHGDDPSPLCARVRAGEDQAGHDLAVEVVDQPWCLDLARLNRLRCNAALDRHRPPDHGSHAQAA